MSAVVKSVANMLARARPILKRLPHNAIMVEVGVSTALLAEYLLHQRPEIEWHGVDPWASSREQREHYVRSGDVHAVLTDSQTESNYQMALRRLRQFGSRAIVHREWSPEVVAERFWPGTVDLVFLDGDHSYDGVIADIEAWYPIVKWYGWIGGHDYDNKDPRFRFGVKKAVDEWFRNPVQLDEGLTWWVRKRG